MNETYEIDGRVETVCPQCAVGCRLRYDEDAGRATGVENAPVNHEGRLCPKGIRAFDALDADDRLTRPLVRFEGDLEPVSWKRAYDRIERGVRAVVDEHGPDALAFLGAPRCTNEENYLFQKLARALGTNNVDNRARSCHEAVASAMADRLGSGAMTNSLEDLAEANAVLVVGADPATRQPIAFNSYVRPAINGGATLLQIDPGENRTTRLADIHLASRPGTDALVLGLLTAIVLDEMLIDREFVAERTTGFETYTEQLRGLDIEKGARRAGVDPDRLYAAARAFGRAERGAVIAGTGVESGGRPAADVLVNLLLCTGNLGRRGTGVNLFRGLVNEQGANDAGARPATLPGYAPVTDTAARARVAEVWGFEPPATPGLAELDAVRAFGEDIRGAFVLGENPAVSTLEDEVIREGFDALDVLVVQDLFPTETTAHADVVLPASAFAEKAGTVTNLDRQVQRLWPAATPPGRTRRDSRILQDLGGRLTDAGFAYEDASAVFEELVAVNPSYRGLSYAGIGHGSGRWPREDDTREGTAVLHRDRFADGARRASIAPLPADALGVDTEPGARD